MTMLLVALRESGYMLSVIFTSYLFAVKVTIIYSFRMGHGASTLPQDRISTVFGLAQLQAGNELMMENPKMRNSFLNYVKGGLWVDCILQSMNFIGMPISHEERLAREKQNIVYEYKMPQGKSENICKYFTARDMTSSEKSVKGTNSISLSNSVHSNSERIAESYVNIEQCDCFTAAQLIAILFGVVFAMYLVSKQYQSFLKLGEDNEGAEDKDSSGDANSGTHASRRAQQILLGTAAHFDELVLHEQLESTDWVKTLGQTFDNHKLAITVSDTKIEGCFLVYANHAFEKLSGHLNSSFIREKSLDLLNGVDTEAPMIESVHEALRIRKPLKVALTHYTSKGRSFTNLLAMRPHKTYMIAVHVVADKHARLSDLMLVEDVLSLLAYLVKPPEPKPSVMPKNGTSCKAQSGRLPVYVSSKGVGTTHHASNNAPGVARTNKSVKKATSESNSKSNPGILSSRLRKGAYPQNMGHGVSTLPQDMVSTVFGLAQLQAGNELMFENPKMRNSFLNYVKGGLWVDCIVQSMNFIRVPISHEERLAREKQNVVYEYKMSRGKSEDICKHFTRELTSSEKSAKVATSVSLANSVNERSERITECYVNIEQCDCFTAAQLIAILFGVVLPMYLGSKQYQLFLKMGKECDIAEDKDSAGDPNSGTKASRRAQEILLGTAAYFDEVVLREHVECTDWVKTLGQTFDNHKLAITMSDTKAEGCLLVYANRAFEKLSGHSCSSIIGERSLDVLNGAETEAPMLELVHEAMRLRKPLKVALTHYTSKGRSFTNLMAMRPHKTYMMAVHVISCKNALVSDLVLVDDVLSLMAYLVKPPDSKSSAKLKKGTSTRALSSWLPIYTSSKLGATTAQVSDSACGTARTEKQ